MTATPAPIQLGDTVDPGNPPRCCKRPMQFVDSGIWECMTCGCYLMAVSITDYTVERVQQCDSHDGGA